MQGSFSYAEPVAAARPAVGTGSPLVARAAAGQPAPAVRFDAIEKIYPARGKAGAVPVFSGLNLSVPAGQIVGIVGRSGAGKSTLIRLVNALERPTSGRVVVHGVDIAAATGAALRRAQRSTGMIFQHFNLLSSRTAAANIALPLEIAGWRSEAIRRRVEQLLELVGLADKARRYPAELSGGQKQRVGIARALATEPQLLLSDEATSALDPETTRSILALLARVNTELGVTILMVSHQIDAIKQVCGQVVVLDGGVIVEQGAVLDLLTQPCHPAAAAILGSALELALPPAIECRRIPTAAAGASALLRLVAAADAATAPAVSRLAAALGTDVPIVAGQIQLIAGTPLSTLVVAVPGDRVIEAGALLAGLGVTWACLGHVA